MNQIVTTAALCALLVGPAAAQDRLYDWSGAYAGVQVGQGSGSARLDYLNPKVFGTAHDVDGPLGGFYAGYNLHLPSNLVMGVDADIAWSRARTGFKPLLPDLLDSGAVSIDNSFALRARLGFAADRFLPYIAGGIAVSRANFIYDMSTEDAVVSRSMSAWTWGAGLEYAATDNIIVRAEYRYTDFGGGSAKAFPSFPTHWARYDLKTQDIRLGVSFKF